MQRERPELPGQAQDETLALPGPSWADLCAARREAERNAWDALAHGRFYNFGFWAGLACETAQIIGMGLWDEEHPLAAVLQFAHGINRSLCDPSSVPIVKEKAQVQILTRMFRIETEALLALKAGNFETFGLKAASWRKFQILMPAAARMPHPFEGLVLLAQARIKDNIPKED